MPTLLLPAPTWPATAKIPAPALVVGDSALAVKSRWESSAPVPAPLDARTPAVEIFAVEMSAERIASVPPDEMTLTSPEMVIPLKIEEPPIAGAPAISATMVGEI